MMKIPEAPPLALAGEDSRLAVKAAQANRTHRWLAALPPKKLKKKKDGELTL
ncbi:MAG: hypothetical protein MPK06_00365 [Alphaproteobacteria bacterium]|nr:hypothetical protein [Alphaproteobacteria bacterium]MDA8003675.1 hypothetical protein [Alphaproteobacteria bacterium]MDA8004996.1 hypothetical protein [Alphaproteobacteria bacterium]MDA8013268.1 hypothetical protein [Alphaproteobacteria bacterium]